MKIAESLNGSVQSQGILLDYRAWLDMGSKEWAETPDRAKAAAYQAAKLRGWTDAGLFSIIIKEFAPRVDEFMANVTIETLQDLTMVHPFEVEGERILVEVSVKSGDQTFKM